MIFKSSLVYCYPKPSFMSLIQINRTENLLLSFICCFSQPGKKINFLSQAFSGVCWLYFPPRKSSNYIFKLDIQ